MRWIFRDKPEAAPEPLEVGSLGAVIPAETMALLRGGDRVTWYGASLACRLDEVERRILALEGKGDDA